MTALSNPLQFPWSGTFGHVQADLQPEQAEDLLRQRIEQFELSKETASPRSVIWFSYEAAQTQQASLSGVRLNVASGQQPVAPRQESAEMRWLISRGEDLAQYAGEWLLIVSNDLAAHSSDFNDIKRAIRERDIQSPFVHYVPSADES